MTGEGGVRAVWSAQLRFVNLAADFPSCPALSRMAQADLAAYDDDRLAYFLTFSNGFI